MAQHIQTIIDREYVTERMEGRTKYLIPSTLGIGLVEGYNKIGFDKSLSKPQLRREVRPLCHHETCSTDTYLSGDGTNDGPSMREPTNEREHDGTEYRAVSSSVCPGTDELRTGH